MKKPFFAVLITALFVSVVFAIGKHYKYQIAQNSDIAFVNVNVVPMDGERILRNQTVVIRGGRISKIGLVNQIRLPKNIITVDGHGQQYLMPGLADMHVHLEYFDRDEQLLLFLAGGVTTVRSMDGRPNILLWRKRIDEGTLLGPTIFTAGAILEGKPPFRNDNKVVETATQAEAAVEEQKKAGYDFIKVNQTLNRESYEAIIASARKNGFTVVGHVPRSVGLRGVLMSNQKSIEHLDGYLDEIEAENSPLKNQRSWLKRYFAVEVDENKILSIIEATHEAKAWNVPTLIERQLSALSADELQARLKQPEMSYLPPQTAALWTQTNARATGRMAADDFASLTQGEKVRNRLVKSLHDKGARLLAGTDTPNAFVIPGFSLIEELQNFVAAGLTPYQSIKASTKDAAEFFGENDTFGTISVGSRADLLLIEGNPLENIANIKHRIGVMTRGQWLTSEDLQKRLNALAASYKK